MAVEFAEEGVNIVQSTCRSLLYGDEDVDNIEGCLNRLIALHRNCLRMATRHPEFDELSAIVLTLINTTEERKRSLRPSIGFLAARQERTRGRPLYVISRDQLEYMVEAGFSRKTMASLLHVSDSVVKRRLRHFGINLRAAYADMSDAELDDMVRAITEDNSSLGQRMVQGILSSRGIRVQRQRIADSLIRVDAAAVALRWCRSIRRRTYRVAGPNSLWHIDGNHKLIRWGFVIHGGIDGYSRLCVFLQVSNNNRSSTMTQAFLSGTQAYGVPSRVRADKGLENTGVGAYMLAVRGPQRGSFITGRSVHNQRIERLWRDMTTSCTSVFRGLFTHMEETGQLDLDNDLHMWCLHHVFSRRIQHALSVFQEGWNSHRLSDERGRTPTQLFLQGVIERAGQGHTGIDNLMIGEQPNLDQSDFGIDAEAPPTQEDITEIDIPVRNCPVSNEQYERLCSTINPMEGGGLGLDVYLQCVRFCEDFDHVPV